MILKLLTFSGLLLILTGCLSGENPDDYERIDSLTKVQQQYEEAKNDVAREELIKSLVDKKIYLKGKVISVDEYRSDYKIKVYDRKKRNSHMIYINDKEIALNIEDGKEYAFDCVITGKYHTGYVETWPTFECDYINHMSIEEYDKMIKEEARIAEEKAIAKEHSDRQARLKSVTYIKDVIKNGRIIDTKKFPGGMPGGLLYDEKVINAVAEYIQEGFPAGHSGAEGFMVGACSGCHGENGEGLEYVAPRLKY